MLHDDDDGDVMQFSSQLSFKIKMILPSVYIFVAMNMQQNFIVAWKMIRMLASTRNILCNNQQTVKKNLNYYIVSITLNSSKLNNFDRSEKFLFCLENYFQNIENVQVTKFEYFSLRKFFVLQSPRFLTYMKKKKKLFMDNFERVVV